MVKLLLSPTQQRILQLNITCHKEHTDVVLSGCELFKEHERFKWCNSIIVTAVIILNYTSVFYISASLNNRTL